MQIIPVLDLLNGQVVRGVAGRREEYRPLQSRLVEGADALAVANALREQFHISTIYVADLDAILHREPNLDLVRRIADAGFSILLDAGLRTADDAEPLIAVGAAQVIAGLETIEGPRTLADLCAQFGPERIVFSLDLKLDRPMANERWSDQPIDVACAAVEAGVQRMIVLDLAGVGVAGGVTTLPLCRRIREECANVQLITGGGVRNVADLRTLAAAGIDGALVATALHDGSITPHELAAIHEPT